MARQLMYETIWPWKAEELNEEAWRVSLESERLSPPEADDLPIWMGIETPVVRPFGLTHDSEDSRSAGSFDFFGEGADDKTWSGSPWNLVCWHLPTSMGNVNGKETHDPEHTFFMKITKHLQRWTTGQNDLRLAQGITWTVIFLSVALEAFSTTTKSFKIWRSSKTKQSFKNNLGKNKIG